MWGLCNQIIWSSEKLSNSLNGRRLLWLFHIRLISTASFIFSSRWFVKKCADGSLRAHLSSWMREPTDQGQSRKIQTDVLEHISMDIFDWKISLILYVPHWKTELNHFHLYHFAVSFTRFARKKVFLVHVKTWLKYCVFVLVCPRFRDQEENLALSGNKSLHPCILSFGFTYLRNSKNRDKDPEKRSSCADWPAQPEQQSGLWYWPTLPDQQGWSDNNSKPIIHTHTW